MFVDENACVKTTIDLKEKIQRTEILMLFFILTKKFFLIGENSIQKTEDSDETQDKMKKRLSKQLESLQKTSSIKKTKRLFSHGKRI